MKARKRKFINRIIIVSAISFAIFLIGFWFNRKRTNRDYVLPQGYEGWVCIKYKVPGAPELPLQDGVLVITLPDSGYLETSSSLESGWGKDRFFRGGHTPEQELPAYVDTDTGPRVYIHGRDAKYFSHEHLLAALPVGTDTLLWDDTRIIKETAEQISYQPGALTLEFFYVSAQPQPIVFEFPPNPNQEALESTESRWMEGK